MSKSNYLEAAQLNWLRGTAMPAAPEAVYIGLLTAAPTEAGAVTEISGNGYTREEVELGAVAQAADDATIANTSEITFGPATGAGWSEATHWGLFDAASGGNLLHFGALGTPRTVGSGDTASYAIGAFVVGER